MIPEALHWALTPAPGWARRTGYLSELIAFRARHRRWRQRWAPHLQASQDAIRIAMARCTSHRQALVLGSGPLLDIPLADLSAAFETVTLVDAAHLWPTRLTARRFPNIRLVERDISGVVPGLLEGVAHGSDILPRPRPKLPEDHATVDFVVSANLLSQLAVLPLQFMSHHVSLTPAEQTGVIHSMVQAHLDYLKQFDAICCLITDTRHEFVDRDGAVQNFDNCLPGIILPPDDSSWWWDVAPPGEYLPEFGVRVRVVAITQRPAGSGL